jgi:hypothetical protein
VAQLDAATISQTPKIRLYSPNSRARVIAPMPGRAPVTTPKAMDTSPVRMSIARPRRLPALGGSEQLEEAG